MCGIFGHRHPQHADQALVERMAQRLAHRGPDGYGISPSADFVFGAGRLAIIDLSAPAGPLFNEDGQIGVAFNGEIYNYRALRAELERQGHHFRTRTDTEVLVHGYEQWGLDLLPRLNGMFALCLWDKTQARWLLARDRCGEKPLYLWQNGAEFAFASELKGLLEHPAIPRQMDSRAVAQYLTLGYVPAPYTILAGVRKLAPAEWLLIERDGQTHSGCYWQAAAAVQDNTPLPYAVAVQQVREQLIQTVDSRRVSDVPVGAFLSGGIDSTAVTGVLCHLAGQPVHTFTVGYETTDDQNDQKFNVDVRYAALAAEQFGSQHHVLMWRATPALVDLLPRFIYAMDEPIAQPALISTALVAALARTQAIPVLLTGDAGDELFCGYDHFRLDAQLERYLRLPTLLRDQVLTPLLERLPQPKAQSLAQKIRQARTPVGRYLAWKRFMSLAETAALRGVAPDTLDGLFEDTLAPLLAAPKGRTFTERLAFSELFSWVADESNMRLDKLTMAVSIEARAPLLDHEFVSLALRQPLAYKLRGGDFKAIFKAAAAPWLPEAILRRPKWGFNPPLSGWLRTTLRPLVEQVLSEDHVAAVGLCQPAAVRRLVTAHLNKTSYHFPVLWALLTLHLWHDLYISQSRPSTTPLHASELTHALIT